MDNITIPPEALAAAMRAYLLRQEDDTEVSFEECLRAACLAMLREWPRMDIKKSIVFGDKLILPLTKEQKL